jgi:hypothetical protein
MHVTPGRMAADTGTSPEWLRTGRRFLHFSNQQAYIDQGSFIKALTSAGRNLGSNRAQDALILPNEMEYSMSLNIGTNWRDDLPGRIRGIDLAYYQEDPNSRVFNDPFLHETVRKDRDYWLSAIGALFEECVRLGQPKGNCTSPEKTDTEIWLTNTVSGLTRTLHFIQGRNPA